MILTRRDALRLGVLGTAGAAVVGLPLGDRLRAKSASRVDSSRLPKPYQAPFVRPPVLQPYTTVVDADGVTTAKYEVAAQPGTLNILRGLPTPAFGYNGVFPGPTISVEQGTEVELRVRNHLPPIHPTMGYRPDMSTHLHGSASLPQYDGYADDITYPGYKKTYRYPNFQPARTLWYHDHGVHRTAQTVYSGLAAQYHLHDPVERALLPQGEFDVPLMMSDAMFAADGTLLYDDRTHSGLWGDVVLVNGQAWPTLQVKRRIYRFRVLNASISRSYRPTLSTGDPITVVATDGGLVPTAQQVTSWRHGPAERYEVLIDFSRYAPGTRIELRNLSNPNNVDYSNTGKIMAFDVIDAPVDTTDGTALTLPRSLAPSDVMTLQPSKSTPVRRLRVKRNSAGIWTVGDQSWQEIVESGFTKAFARPNLGATEVWEIENSSGGWFHPVHIHLVDFKVLSRNGKPPQPWELGPKDVVYVGEGETVRVAMTFGPHKGRYMVHCHNLPHEDHDMMTQFVVGLAPGDWDDNDPIDAARCVPDSDED